MPEEHAPGEDHSPAMSDEDARNEARRAVSAMVFDARVAFAEQCTKHSTDESPPSFRRVEMSVAVAAFNNAIVEMVAGLHVSVDVISEWAEREQAARRDGDAAWAQLAGCAKLFWPRPQAGFASRAHVADFDETVGGRNLGDLHPNEPDTVVCPECRGNKTTDTPGSQAGFILAPRPCARCAGAGVVRKKER